MLTTDANSLPRLMACNGSRFMAGQVPAVTVDSTSREEGIAAHYMLATALHKGVQQLDTLVDKKAPNGVFMDAAMCEHVAEFISVVQSRPAASRYDEHGFSFGTDAWSVDCNPDSVSWSSDGIYMWLDDLRYGRRIVEPDHNWTMIANAIGLIRRRSSPPPQYICFTIHQPRQRHPLGPVRHTWVSYIDLMHYAATMDRILSALSDTLNTGSHCGGCPAVGFCPAASAASANAIDASSVAFVDNIDNASLAYELDELKRASLAIKTRLDAYEELAASRVRKGDQVPNYVLETSYSNRQFKPGIDVAMASMLLRCNAAAPAKLATPAELERRGADKDMLAHITHRPSTGTKLVRVDADKYAAKLLNGAKSE